MKTVKMRFVPLAAMLLLAGTVHAGTEALWRTASKVSPTAMPLYTGGPSPFPQLVAAVSLTQQVSSTEEVEQFQRWETALHRAEKLLNSKEGFQPSFSGVQIGARTDGPLGPRLMVAGEWIGPGQTVYVRRALSGAAVLALADLDAMNPTAAQDIHAAFTAKLAQEPYMPVKVLVIGANALEFESIYGRQKTSLSQTEN